MKEQLEDSSPQEIKIEDLNENSKIILVSPFGKGELQLAVEVDGEFIKRLDKIIRKKGERVMVVDGNGVFLAQTLPFSRAR